MPFSRPSLSTLQAQALNDIQAASLPSGGLLRKSILRVLAYTQAGFAYLHYSYLDWIAQQSVPATATGENMEAWAALRGVLRQGATAASGTATLTGVNGTVIPLATRLLRGDGYVYETTAEGTIGVTGTITLAIKATLDGSDGNASTGVTLKLSSPITGVLTNAVTATAVVGGVEQETDASLRSRMLQKYAAPPQGGATSDYVTWALEVPGVTRAWCSANSPAIGAVTVYIMLDVAHAGTNGFPIGTDGGAASETRTTAGAGDQLIVADYIYPVRPATALVYVKAPVAQVVNFTIANLSPNTTAVQDEIKVALKDLFVRQGTPLGGVIYPSDINAAIESVAGVARFTLSSPTTPVTTTAGSLPTLGTVTFS